jgi:hypothetical protein
MGDNCNNVNQMEKKHKIFKTSEVSNRCSRHTVPSCNWSSPPSQSYCSSTSFPTPLSSGPQLPYLNHQPSPYPKAFVLLISTSYFCYIQMAIPPFPNNGHYYQQSPRWGDDNDLWNSSSIIHTKTHYHGINQNSTRIKIKPLWKTQIIADLSIIG